MHHCITRHSSYSRIKVQFHLSWSLQGEEFSFSSKGDLIEVYKKSHVKFQAERVGNVYMLQNSKVTVGGLQLSSASETAIVEQSETMMVLSSDVQLYPKEKLGLDAQ